MCLGLTMACEVEVGFTEVVQDHVGGFFARGFLFRFLSWRHSGECVEVGMDGVFAG